MNCTKYEKKTISTNYIKKLFVKHIYLDAKKKKIDLNF